jgi:hypothetical protein
MRQIESVRVLTVGASAQTVNVRGLAFLLQNNSDSATVYFKERRDDGTDASSANGFALGPGAVLPQALTARELSVISTAAGTDVRLLILDEV